jgi:lipopolysaccharide biosynthesis glycosyltransferase
MTRSSEADRPICLLFCVDDGYLAQAAVALASILESNPSTAVAVTLAAFDRDPARAEALFAPLLARHPACRLVYRDLDDTTLFDGLPVTRRFSRSIYTRILFDRFVDEAHERVLYLDADVVTCANLRPLWNTPLEGKAVAAVRDHFRLDLEDIGFSPDESYFNSGVLLIDRQAWRADGFERRILALLAESGHRLPWMDQDALNLVLRGHVRFVGLEWNFQPRCADVPAGFLGLEPGAYARLRASPRIIHYTTSQKPWNAGYRIHYSDRYIRAARALARNGTPPGALAGALPVDSPRRLRERLVQAALREKTRMRWHFPRAFRFLRRRLRPEAAALMYRARAEA